MSAATAVYAYPQRAPEQERGRSRLGDYRGGVKGQSCCGDHFPCVTVPPDKVRTARRAYSIAVPEAGGVCMSDDAYRQIRRKVEIIGPAFAIEQVWLWKHEPGTYVKFTPAGADPFA
jgi:hypothetical protein